MTTPAEPQEVAGAEDVQRPGSGHVHDWRPLKSEEVQDPTAGPSAYGWQTVVLLRCSVCGDVDSRTLAGRWSLEDLERVPAPVTPGSGSEEESNG